VKFSIATFNFFAATIATNKCTNRHNDKGKNNNLQIKITVKNDNVPNTVKKKTILLLIEQCNQKLIKGELNIRQSNDEDESHHILC